MNHNEKDALRITCQSDEQYHRLLAQDETAMVRRAVECEISANAASNAGERKLMDRQIAIAARALADRNADACGVNRDDNWKVFGNDFIEDARVAFAAIESELANAASATTPEPAEQALALVNLLQRWASWIVRERPKNLMDHACARCVPHSDILIDGFNCVYHEALDTVGGSIPHAAAHAEQAVLPLAALADQVQWISVDDGRKPESRKPVLLFVKTMTRSEDGDLEGAEIAMGEYREGLSAEMSYFDCYTSPMSDSDWITHWMPLPDAPVLRTSAATGEKGGAA